MMMGSSGWQQTVATLWECPSIVCTHCFVWKSHTCRHGEGGGTALRRTVRAARGGGQGIGDHKNRGGSARIEPRAGEQGKTHAGGAGGGGLMGLAP